MSGKSDEEKLGFSYEVLDEYIRTGNISDLRIKRKNRLFTQNKFYTKFYLCHRIKKGEK